MSFPRLRKLKDDARQIYWANPFDPPELTQLLASSTKQSVSSRPPMYTSSISRTDTAVSGFSNSKDFFSQLPIEVREKILINLPSRDVYILRVSLRAFATIPLSQTFWASRFDR